MEILISNEPWETLEVDAFVCPTNSVGMMTQHPTSRVQNLVGIPLEPVLRPHTPLAVGAAFVTSAGNMRAHYLIHVPNTDQPGGSVQVEDVLRAASAVLVACEARRFASIAIPLMGAFDAGIPGAEAARAITSQLRAYKGEYPARVTLAPRTPEEHEMFEMAIEATS